MHDSSEGPARILDWGVERHKHVQILTSTFRTCKGPEGSCEQLGRELTSLCDLDRSQLHGHIYSRTCSCSEAEDSRDGNVNNKNMNVFRPTSAAMTLRIPRSAGSATEASCGSVARPRLPHTCVQRHHFFHRSEHSSRYCTEWFGATSMDFVPQEPAVQAHDSKSTESVHTSWATKWPVQTHTVLVSGISACISAHTPFPRTDAVQIFSLRSDSNRSRPQTVRYPTGHLR